MRSKLVSPGEAVTLGEQGLKVDLFSQNGERTGFYTFGSNISQQVLLSGKQKI